MKLILLFAIIFSCVGFQCGQPPEAESKKEVPQKDSLNSQGRSQEHQQNDYVIQSGTFKIPLTEWENNITIQEALGRPSSVRVDTLGPGADTHMGSKIKTLTYPGLEVKFFIPKTTDTGWVLSIDVSDKNHATSKNIKIGDDSLALKKAYPNIQRFPDGRTNSTKASYYLSSGDDFLKFDLESGIIRRIQVYHEIP